MKQIFPKREKTDFFRDLALRHLPEMRLLLRGGKLWKNEGWRNVVEHCLVQGAIAEKLSSLLNLPEKDSRDLVTTALCHDWAKRLEKKPEDFNEEDKAEAVEFLEKAAPNQKLMESTGIEFLERSFIKKESTFLERLQVYIDDIVAGSEITTFENRLDELARRRPELNEDPELNAKVGGKFLDKQKEMNGEIAKEIFEMLKERGIDAGSPEEIPAFLSGEIEKEWKADKGEVRPEN